MPSNVTDKRLEALPQATRERIAHIDFTLMFKGEAVRADLIERFNIAPAQVTKDFTLYREIAPQNIEYDAQRRLHVRGTHFRSLFQYDSLRTLATLTQGFGDGFSGKGKIPFPFEAPHQLNQPNLSIIATLTEAIHKRKAVQIRYVSLSSGETIREITPHTLVDSGLRWHLRAYDRSHQEFRDFVLTRVKQCSLLADSQTETAELLMNDEQWNTFITLELIPHPNIKHQEAIALDYAMTDGVKGIQSRVAMAGYLLRLWNVDCSLVPSGDKAHQLALRNPHVFHSLMSIYPNLCLAPH